jgi:hypothetical protein
MEDSDMVAVDPKMVIEETRRLLKSSKKPVGKALRVSDEFLQEGDWLHLIVYPVAAPTASKKRKISALDYVDEIEGIETTLHKKFGDKILIVPAKP